MSDSIPVLANTELVQEHQSNALLIKLAWIIIAGWCVNFIATLWWDETLTGAYLVSKVGIDIWMISGLGLIVFADLWLRATSRTNLIATRINKVAAGLVLTWFLSVAASWWFSAAYNATKLVIDLAASLVGLLILAPATFQNPENKKKALAFGIGYSLVWLLAGSVLLIGVWLWLRGSTESATVAAIGTSVPTLIALIIGAYSLIVIVQLQRANEDRAIGPRGVARAIDRVAWFIAFCCLGLLLGAAYLAKRESVSTTVVTAIMGFGAAVMTTRISISPHFADRLRVVSSSMGTQFIYPSELLSVFEDASMMHGSELSSVVLSDEKDKGLLGTNINTAMTDGIKITTDTDQQ